MSLTAGSPALSGREILSVGELTRRIKRILEDSLRYLWVAGEISNLRPPGPRGHLYFTLKDDESQIPCALWKGYASRLRFQPADGQEVLAFGRVEVYLPQGRYQLIVEEMEPRGVGTLQLRFEQLKQKLAAEGLFDPARKRPLPLLPLTVALITSPVGAALQDMLRTLRTRCPVTRILIYPVRVQGEGAAEEIAAAIAQLNLTRPDVDLMIVGRGGGSIEDLWAFNEEIVARAIHASRIPVVSAVGHETDTTIADFVADVRALTPTDGAVRAVPRLDEIMLRMGDLETTLKRALRTRADLARSALDLLRKGRTLGRIEEIPLLLTQRLDELREHLRGGLQQASAQIRSRIESLRGSLEGRLPAIPALARGRLDSLVGLLTTNTRRIAEGAAARWRTAAAGLEALSPLKVLSRGYSITRLEKSGEILREARGAAPGDLLRTLLGSGSILSRVEAPPPQTLDA